MFEQKTDLRSTHSATLESHLVLLIVALVCEKLRKTKIVSK